MKQNSTKLFFLALGLLISGAASAQCGIKTAALEEDIFESSAGGTGNRCGVAYNPIAKLYYSVNAGSSNYPIDTYDATTGALVNDVPQGVDYRGAWWNPITNQFEGNAYNSQGIILHTLSAGTSYPNGTTSFLFTGAQPDAQSIGKLDWDAMEIIYYYDGFIHRYDRTDNSFLGQYSISGLPGSVTSADLNSNSIVYTGCPGKEIGVFDFTNKQLLFINKADGSYVGASQLPGTAPAPSSFKMSYANDLLWLYDDTSSSWITYSVTQSDASIDENDLGAKFTMSPNPVVDQLTITVDNEMNNYSFQVVDLNGRVLQTAAFNQETTVDLSELAKGTYIVRLTSDKGSASQHVTKL